MTPVQGASGTETRLRQSVLEAVDSAGPRVEKGPEVDGGFGNGVGQCYMLLLLVYWPRGE